MIAAVYARTATDEGRGRVTHLTRHPPKVRPVSSIHVA